MKLKTIFLIMFSIWCLDYLTTFIALNFFKGFYERNKIFSELFLIGWNGWALVFIISFIIIFILSFFMYKTSEFGVKITKKEKVGKIIVYIGVGFFFVLEFYAVINNIHWIFV